MSQISFGRALKPNVLHILLRDETAYFFIVLFLFFNVPQKAPIGQRYTKMPPYIVYFLKQKCIVVVQFLAVFFTFAKLVFNLVISDIINTYIDVQL